MNKCKECTVCQGRCGLVSNSTADYFQAVEKEWEAIPFVGDEHPHLTKAELEESAYDPINPPHYKTPSGMDVFDVITDWKITNQPQGHGLKYLLRAGQKGDYCQDIDKAIKCLQRAKEEHIKAKG